jgi:serine/threonine protein phosphatase 1
MPKRIIAIGDIHGCGRALEAVLDRIEPDASDTVVALGDLIDRGPDTPAVLDRLLKLATQCELVRLIGNHEIMLLTALEQPSEIQFWLECGGEPTVEAYGGDMSAIPPAHVDFLRGCRPFYETEDHFFVHANYVADLPLSQQPQFTLLWEHLSLRRPGPHMSGKIGVVGHTPQVNGEILDLEHLLCIDTYCYGGGWLTALDVTSGNYWQANSAGEMRIE